MSQNQRMKLQVMPMEQAKQTKMYDPKVDIKKCCHVNSGEDGENFVGVKADDRGSSCILSYRLSIARKRL